MYSLMPGSSARVQSFSDILYTQYEHYFTWGGRSVVHVIDQTLLLLGSELADLLNSIAYVSLTLVIYFIANQSNKVRPSLLIVINLLLWFFQPAFGSTILWITGSANYLWGTLIILLFLLPYVRFVYKSTQSQNSLKTVLMLPFGILAGWTNENMAIALIFMLFVFVFYYKADKKNLPLWAIMGLVGVVIGSIIMIAAPGNYVRMEMILEGMPNNQSIVSLYIGRVLASLAAYYYYVLATTFIYFLLVIFYKNFGINDKKSVSFISILFFFGAIVATLAMSGAPIFPGRASFGINVLLFVAIGTLYSNLHFSKSIVRFLSCTVIIFAILIFVADYIRAYKCLNEVNEHCIARLKVVEQGKLNGQKDFILDDRISVPGNRFLHYFELTPDSTDWHNRMYSKYNVINTIVVK